MKKICFVLIFTIVIQLLFVQNIIASETTNKSTSVSLSSSTVIDQSVREQLECDSNTDIMRMLIVPQRAIVFYENLQSYLKDEASVYRVEYLTTNLKGETTYRSIDSSGKLVISQGDVCAIDAKTVGVLKNYKSIIAEIVPDAVIKNVYFLNGRANMTGMSIYYETSKGDFVYHFGDKDIENGNGAHFFTWESFRKVQLLIIDKYKEMMEDGNVLYGGSNIDIGQYIDLSKYDLNSDSFSPLSSVGDADVNKANDSTDLDTQKPTNVALWIGVSSVVAVVLIAGAVFGIIKLCKR